MSTISTRSWAGKSNDQNIAGRDALSDINVDCRTCVWWESGPLTTIPDFSEGVQGGHCLHPTSELGLQSPTVNIGICVDHEFGSAHEKAAILARKLDGGG